MYGNLKTGFQTIEENSEEIYLGDELIVVEGSNCFCRETVVLDNGELKINGVTLEGFLSHEYTIKKSGKNELLSKLKQN